MQICFRLRILALCQIHYALVSPQVGGLPMLCFVRHHQIKLPRTDSRYQLVKYHSILYQGCSEDGGSKEKSKCMAVGKWSWKHEMRIKLYRFSDTGNSTCMEEQRTACFLLISKSVIRWKNKWQGGIGNSETSYCGWNCKTPHFFKENINLLSSDKLSRFWKWW